MSILPLSHQPYYAIPSVNLLNYFQSTRLFGPTAHSEAKQSEAVAQSPSSLSQEPPSDFQSKFIHNVFKNTNISPLSLAFCQTKEAMHLQCPLLKESSHFPDHPSSLLCPCFSLNFSFLNMSDQTRHRFQNKVSPVPCIVVLKFPCRCRKLRL